MLIMADGYCSVSSTGHAVRLTVPTKVIVNKKFFADSYLWPDSSSTMYNNTSYSGQGYQGTYDQYQQSYPAGYGYDGYGQQPQYVSTNVQPVPPGEEYPQNNWAPTAGYHGNNATTPGFETKKEDEAVAQERQAQNAQLIKQREDYVKKARVLRRELELLRNQKHEIMSQNSSKRDMELILKENVKLQDEIQSKMKAIHNVIEMLSSIIKDGRKISDLEAALDQSPSAASRSKSESNDGVKYNYMHYDPELHWCRMCDEFPKTAKDFLLHLQSDKHKNNIQENDVSDNTPWHKLAPEAELPTYEGAQKKRIPIRGLQFFIAAPAWYCKLCDTWIGDLHCASHHLKSQAHFQNYANFVEQTPHWEIEWLKDREKAMSRSEKPGASSDSDDDKKKKKHRSKRSAPDANNKDKKKKKKSKKRRKHSSDTSSSSSSSDSSSDDDEQGDKSKSIRVVMRNMKVQSIMNEDLSGKWEMLERLVDEHKKKEETQQRNKDKTREPPQEDKLINQWMTVSEPQEKEKVLLDSLKDRMRQKQEQERIKQAELDKKQRDKEREEREHADRKAREERDAKDRNERERKDRERQEYERIRDKDRDQVKFKTRDRSDRDNYRKRRSPSRSPPEREYRRDRENGRSSSSRRSRSRSSDRKDKKPSGPPPSKRLPFIGRMPLFKNRKFEEREQKEVLKEDYDIPRVTRFQPGTLARAFLPQPDVVRFPKLSCFPELMMPPPPVVKPPPPPVVTPEPPPAPPAPPKISVERPLPPPPPKIGVKVVEKKLSKIEEEVRREEAEEPPFDESMYEDPGLDQSMMNQYYQGMEYNMMYSQMYDYSQCQQEEQPQPPPPEEVPLAHTMPLLPPPLPPSDPNDDLAMLGISVDDMAAQSF